MNFVNKYDIDDEELEKLALDECKLIVDYFTSEEINKLKFHSINPEYTSTCIYGVMTGDCNTEKVYKFVQKLDTVIIEENFTEDVFNLNIRSHYYLTPLEHFILQDTLIEEYKNRNLEDQDRMPNTALIVTEIKRLQNANN
jgi:hypothetical protein